VATPGHRQLADKLNPLVERFSKPAGDGYPRGVAAPPSRHEQLLSAAAENMPAAVALVSASDGVVAHTNPTWDRLLGYGPGELTGRHISVVAAPPEEDVPGRRVHEITEGLEREGVWRGDTQYVRRDGSAFWCATSIGQFYDPELGAVWVIVAAPRARPARP
jgi:PAS domain S-box-containing protein